MIVMDSLPLDIVESPWLRKLFGDLDPLLLVPSRKTLDRKWTGQEYDNVVEDLTNNLKEAQHVSTALDLWTNRNTYSFLGITVHFVQNWRIKARLIGFERMYGKNTAVSIREVYNETAKKFCITSNKTVRVLRDCGSNVVCAFPEDLAFLPFDGDDDLNQVVEPTADEVIWEPEEVNVWTASAENDDVLLDEYGLNFDNKGSGMRCTLHVWNRIIVNVLHKSLKLGDILYNAMHRVGKVVHASHKNTKCAEFVEKTLHQKLKTRNETRWLSDYEMIVRFLQLYQLVDNEWWKAFCQLTSTLHFKDIQLTESMVQALTHYTAMLKPFWVAFKALQTQTEARLGEVLPTWEYMYEEYLAWNQLAIPTDLNVFVNHVSEQLKSQYPSDSDFLLTIAAILHPGHRIAWLEEAKLCTNKDQALFAIRQRLQLHAAQPEAAIVKAVVKTTGLREMLNGGKNAAKRRIVTRIVSGEAESGKCYKKAKGEN